MVRQTAVVEGFGATHLAVDSVNRRKLGTGENMELDKRRELQCEGRLYPGLLKLFVHLRCNTGI
jgi:hypothetical protein